MKPLRAESVEHLRHDLRTPVVNILGYSELLIEGAEKRHLEAWIPVLQTIQGGARQLLEDIQTVLAGKKEEEVDLDSFKQNLHAKTAEVLATATSLMENLEDNHRQTRADLDAISRALQRLMEFSGDEGDKLALTRAPLARDTELPLQADFRAGKKREGRILIADDDPANRDLLRRRLEFEGHHVLEAGTGLEALELLKEQACDLLLLDIVMPELDGFQTLARLKQESQWRDLPVIMISTGDELGSAVRCIEMGAEDYLTRPFNRVLLRARIGVSLEKKWLRDQERSRTNELEQTLRLLEEAQAQLAVQASQDALTGLANRRSLDTHLAFRSLHDTPFTVIYMDLNDFKKINDTYGHQAGDDLLKQVGSRLRQAFRATDFVGRWGGDEFVALVDAGSADAEVHVSRIAEAFSQEFVIVSRDREERVRVGAAVGVATWRPGETITEVIHRADAEMYQQKLRNAP